VGFQDLAAMVMKNAIFWYTTLEISEENIASINRIEE
jgi:hypothetical protein